MLKRNFMWHNNFKTIFNCELFPRGFGSHSNQAEYGLASARSPFSTAPTHLSFCYWPLMACSPRDVPPSSQYTWRLDKPPTRFTHLLYSPTRPPSLSPNARLWCQRESQSACRGHEGWSLTLLNAQKRCLWSRRERDALLRADTRGRRRWPPPPSAYSL